MTLHLQYLKDKSGREQSVVLPIKEWRAVEKKLQQTQAKLELLLQIRESIQEVKAFEQGKVKARTLAEFLDEL